MEKYSQKELVEFVGKFTSQSSEEISILLQDPDFKTIVECVLDSSYAATEELAVGEDGRYYEPSSPIMWKYGLHTDIFRDVLSNPKIAPRVAEQWKSAA